MNAFGLATCTDCTAVLDEERTLRHDDTCPVGLDVDRTCDLDRAWFDARPGRSERRRPPTWSERVHMLALSGLPGGTEIHGDVLVRQITPGVRVRSFAGLWARTRKGVSA